MIRNMQSPADLFAIAGLIALTTLAITAPAQAAVPTRTATVAPTNPPTATDQPVAASMNLSPHFTITANPCWYSSGWRCNNIVGAPLYNTAWQVVDYMYTNPSWFSCRAEGGRNNNGPHPNRWVWTQGDLYGAWGWMRDADIYSETNPLPTC